jgi:hypothetical protein
MIRVRFYCSDEDPRPVNTPEVPWDKHPYWITGYNDDSTTIVAYADDMDCLLSRWPGVEAQSVEEVDDYYFSDRFEKPDWFKK